MTRPKKWYLVLYLFKRLSGGGPCQGGWIPVRCWINVLGHQELMAAMLKLRFHLCAMRMTNAKVTKDRKHRISKGVLPFVRMGMGSMMATKWIPSWVIGLNVNGLSDRKALHTQGRCSVAHALHWGKLHWSLNIIHHSNLSSYSYYLEVES